jgi:hypothetical protein
MLLEVDFGLGLAHARLGQRPEEPPKQTSPAAGVFNLEFVVTARFGTNLLGLAGGDDL